MVITPSNIVLLYCAAHFMEMQCDGPSGTPNLISQIEKFLEEGIHLWTWFELLEALRRCQECSISSNSYSTILDRIIGHLIERLVILPSVSSPYTCSSHRSSFQFSCETSSSNNSWRNNFSGPSWWFEHLLFLKVGLIDKVIRTMISHDFDHALVSNFLFYYHKLSCTGAAKSKKESTETTEVVINLLLLLDKRSLSFKDLFSLYQTGFRLRIMSSCSRSKIESLIGPVLDQGTIDYLLLPPSKGMNHAFDVDFILRLAQVFVNEGDFGISLVKVKRVAKMMDSFLMEVAADRHLQPSEFAELITVLPDAARESHDKLYLAMDIYLNAHAGLTEKEKMSICCALNHEKLSAELLRNLTRNLVFPAEAKPRSHAHTQSRIKNLLQENDHLKYFLDSVFRKSFKNTDAKEDTENRTTADDEVLKPKEDLQVMQRVMKSGSHIMNNARFLPKFCSR